MNRRIGITLTEVIIVLLIISVILIIFFKAFNYILDKKIPYYVYNFYNELQYINKSLEKNLRTDENKDLLFSNILQNVDSKGYCSAFTKNLNTVGKVDCENSYLDQKIDLTRNVNYQCSRKFGLSVNSVGNIIFTNNYNPSDYPKCVDNTNYANTIYCSAVPTNQISNLVLDNRVAQGYKCEKVMSGTEQIGGIDIDSKLANMDNESSTKITTVNNISLYFVSLETGQKATYNLNATGSQEAICPFIRPKITGGFCKITDSQPKKNNVSVLRSRTNYVTFARSNNDTTATCKGRAQLQALRAGTTGSWGNVNGGFPDYDYTKPRQFQFGSNDEGISYTTPSVESNCAAYLVGANKKYSTPTNRRETSFKFVTGECNWFNCNYSNNQTITMYLQFKSMQFNQTDLNNYYAKWNNFFSKNNMSPQTIAAIDNKTYNEGNVESQVSGASVKHLIYAAIDKDFSKAEMKKDLFVFEQYGDKIIPVGYLANDRNSPLKFNVYKRSADTGRVYRIGARNMTYCEAMSYVGGKVSEYCGCKDVNGNIVTEFEESTECGTLGCDLRAVRPNFKSVWLPRK